MISALDPNSPRARFNERDYARRDRAITRLIDTWQSVHPRTTPNYAQAELGERWMVDLYIELCTPKES